MSGLSTEAGRLVNSVGEINPRNRDEIGLALYDLTRLVSRMAAEIDRLTEEKR
jgi:hypothetical protein